MSPAHTTTPQTHVYLHTDSRLSPQEMNSEKSYVYIVTCHMHIILHYCPSSCICKQANILSHVTCSYYHTTDSRLSSHRLTSISTQEMNSENSYVYIVICHMNIILHYCPSSCICKQTNILSHVTCSYCHISHIIISALSTTIYHKATCLFQHCPPPYTTKPRVHSSIAHHHIQQSHVSILALPIAIYHKPRVDSSTAHHRIPQSTR